VSIQYQKRAAKSPDTETGTARAVAEQMLAEIARNGQLAVRDYAAKLDHWTGPIVMTAEEIERRIRDIPGAVKHDIEFVTERVRQRREADSGLARGDREWQRCAFARSGRSRLRCSR
jgi:sulfopropanediol 3-dehydrogenase